MYQGFLNIDEEIQIPRLEGEALYNVFFKLRLDRPEIFWATGYKYKYYNDSPNLIFVPEYLFEKAKIKENQKPENKTPRNTSGKNKAGKAEQMDFRYDYFNLDDKNIFRDHEPLLYPAPACNEGGRYYYKEKELSFTKIEDVYKSVASGSEERTRADLSLARRLSDQRSVKRTSGRNRESRT